jgi:PilZ domain-containing protein
MADQNETPQAAIGTRDDDRRRWERIPVAIPIFVRGSDEQGKEFLDLATAVNISAGGALLAIKRYAALNSEVSLEIPAPPQPSPQVPSHGQTMEAAIIRIASSRRGELWAVQFKRPLI